VTGLSLAGRIPSANHEGNVKHEAEFDVLALAPGEDRMVFVIQEERKLGRVFHVQPGDDINGPVTVTLEPLAIIAGRVIDADGNPVSRATIRTDPLPGNFSLILAEGMVSDPKGKFVVPYVPTGCKYALVVESRVAGNKGYPFAFARDVAVRPGETTDVGDIQFKND
jgi:Carboxypeptidase regulatory-like domain